MCSAILFSVYSQIDFYASPAWWGFTTAHDRQRMESVIRRGVRFGCCTTNQAPLAELVAEADETFFKNILHIKQHVLYQLLPDRTQSTYNLWVWVGLCCRWDRRREESCADLPLKKLFITHCVSLFHLLYVPNLLANKHYNTVVVAVLLISGWQQQDCF